ncbi:MAG: SDR family NAD(P)-dependent oxidoreductase [Actinomycetota bacterium]
MLLDKFKLDQRVCIVTGASQGLGVVFSEALAEAGADLVIVTDKQISKLQEVAEQISKKTGREVLPLKVDVTSQQDVMDMVAEADKRFGRVDVIVNNAGIVNSKPALNLSLEEWERVLKVNLTSVYLCSKETARLMLKKRIKGNIINISSGYGEVVDLIPNSAYYASKAAVIHLTKALACEWGHQGIRVNALCPGRFPTPMGESLHKNQRWVKHMCSKIPLGRLGKFDDLKPIIVFMASDASEYISGHIFEVLGGPAEMAGPMGTGLKYLKDLYGEEYIKQFGFNQ